MGKFLQNPNLHSKETKDFEAEKAKMKEELKKVGEEFRPTIQPLIKWQDKLEHDLHASNQELTTLRAANTKKGVAPTGGAKPAKTAGAAGATPPTTDP